MPPASDGTYTVGVNLDRLIPDATHLKTLRYAVLRVNRATLLATELLNLYLRERLHNHGGDGMEHLFDANWLLNAYNEVTHCSDKRGRKAKVMAELRDVRNRLLPAFESVDSAGISQCLNYECRNMAAVASNNVWMHFRRRLLAHVRLHHAISEEEYKVLSKEAKRRRRLELMQVAEDLARPPNEVKRSPAHYHAFVETERGRLGIDAAVGEWKGKPIDYHLKARPARFLKPMVVMLSDREGAGKSSFSLFTMRRTFVPRHVRLDQETVRKLFHLGTSDFVKEKSKKRRKTGEAAAIDLDAPVRRERRSKEDMKAEKDAVFGQVVDLRAAKLRQRHRFDHAFTTDGVCARLQCCTPGTKGKDALSTAKVAPKRGLFAIDELKRRSRIEQLHVVGIDPGKRELVVAVDQDDPKNASVVRYTQVQRQRDMRSRQYAAEVNHTKPFYVTMAEEKLSEQNSRSSNIATFREFCRARREAYDPCLAYYAGDLSHRRRRWKTYVKAQQSEERLYQRLRCIHKKGDERTLVLAYGAWGAIAGRSGAACNRGNAPAIGVGLMRKLSKRFVVALTPEHHTSKTCCKCLSPCGPWTELEEKMGRKIRGVRVCQNEECRLPQNRDRTGASNIGLQFRRLFQGQPPIRQMSDEEREFHRLNVCLECD